MNNIMKKKRMGKQVRNTNYVRLYLFVTEFELHEVNIYKVILT